MASVVREPLSWVLALAAMTLSVAKVWRITDPWFYTGPYFTGILAGFLLHELAHRQVARRYGLYAEFHAYIPGVLVTAATGLVPGIVLLAPGYVAVYAYYHTPHAARGYFYSVAAGPAANIALAAAARLLYAAGIHPAYAAGFAEINAWIAFFNLIPVPPLDGSKVLRSNAPAWAAMLAASLLLLA